MNRLAAFAAAFLLATPFATAGDLPKTLTDDDFRIYPQAQVKLGQLLFYDRILSGTYRVSCATCHNHDRASSNGVRLDGKEEERDDLAVNGEPVYEPFKPSSKHAPTLFNLGAKQFTRMFADGRVERLPDGSFRSLAGKDLPKGLNDVLAVQALFPAVQSDELVGTVENDLTAVAHKGSPAIWDALAARVQDTQEYWPYFNAAFPELESAKNINITHIANAIGAFAGTEWRSDDTPFDRYLGGHQEALTSRQKRGMELFYGKAKCDSCHSGTLQTDHEFYRLGMSFASGIEMLTAWNRNAQFSKSLSARPLEMVRLSAMKGRAAVTLDWPDRFRSRTPSLRNVEVTPPYGHLGIFDTLEEVVAAHLEEKKRHRLDTKEMSDTEVEQVTVFLERRLFLDLEFYTDMPLVHPLTKAEITDLIAFLKSLTDEKGLRGRLGKPAEVPSSLALD